MSEVIMVPLKTSEQAKGSEARHYTQEKQNHGVDACVWRELLQNARDADATEVHCSVTTKDNVKILIFKDNGKGMDWDTLEKGMLTDTGSVKKAGAAGGFGMAKLLLVYVCPDRCEIRTNEHVVRMEGRMYGILPNDGYVKGCEYQITYDQTLESGCRCNPTKEGLQFVLSRSDMKGMKVYFDNELISDNPRSADEVPVRNIDEIQAKVFFYPNRSTIFNSSKKPVAIVTHKGIWVQDIELPEDVKGQIWINTDYEARYVLTASRCSLSWGMNYINSFIGDVQRSPKSVLRPKKNKFYSNIDRMEVIADAKELAQKIHKAINNKEGIINGQKVVLKPDNINEFIKQMSSVIPEGIVENTAPKIERLEEVNVESIKTLIWNPAFLLYNETEKEPHKQYKPETMGVRVKNLLTVWSEFIRQFLIGMKVYNVPYGVGFVFSDSAIALYHKDDKGHWFLINPINSDDKIRYSLTAKADFHKILTSAAHEVAHLTGEPTHSDKFVAAFDRNVEYMLDNMQTFRELWKSF